MNYSYPPDGGFRQPWFSQAACRGVGHHAFYDERKADRTIARYCNNCAVKATCLEWAKDIGMSYGVWGGQLFGKKPREQRPAVWEPECPSPDTSDFVSTPEMVTRLRSSSPETQVEATVTILRVGSNRRSASSNPSTPDAAEKSVRVGSERL